MTADSGEALLTRHWSVSVERDGENILTIESNCLSGRELSDEDEECIRNCARHLLSFVGEVAARESRPAPPLDWQPIETAPKPPSGRRKVIDVWCVTDDLEAARFYFGETCSGVKDRHLWQGRVSEVYWLEGAWRPATGLRMHGLTVTPTHWMSLPDPPRAVRADPAALPQQEK